MMCKYGVFLCRDKKIRAASIYDVIDTALFVAQTYCDKRKSVVCFYC